ncbi:MAG: hypothetical protein CME62_10590 [Halobacteriovoraceae bacterium]|nr:hypothetical protein [Halobacteriovoraceae bacterium]|tara:strand:- start:6638 stop:7009 length:372 start_codon:yes stop_codon:yes gene_type:complete
MSKKNTLYIIYNFKSLDAKEARAAYNIILMYTEDGEVSAKNYPDIFSEGVLSFSTKEELLAVGKKALGSKNFSHVYLLSTDDFNVGIETCHDLSAFKEIFKRYGQLVAGDPEDPDSNIFSRFF